MDYADYCLLQARDRLIRARGALRRGYFNEAWLYAYMAQANVDSYIQMTSPPAAITDRGHVVRTAAGPRIERRSFRGH